ncbi:MAG: nitrous oxide reductase accessory protein NosL [Cyclobacteriaceae bacterium]|nr:nitrous oxide reductase accessory protein NosL [Cyclobacteriaceae bacterium]
MNRASWLLALALYSCTPRPEPLVYGTDGCAYCKMTLTDVRYGAEIVTFKGRVIKFDDTNCLLHYIHSEGIAEQDIYQLLVRDYSNPGAGLIAAKESHYLLSDSLRSPMASGVAAFESADSMQVWKKRVHGIFLTWGEVVTQFK